jgi:hypothetical protein
VASIGLRFAINLACCSKADQPAAAWYLRFQVGGFFALWAKKPPTQNKKSLFA